MIITDILKEMPKGDVEKLAELSTSLESIEKIIEKIKQKHMQQLFDTVINNEGLNRLTRMQGYVEGLEELRKIAKYAKSSLTA